QRQARYRGRRRGFGVRGVRAQAARRALGTRLQRGRHLTARVENAGHCYDPPRHMIDIVERYGAALIFALLFLDQVGVPIPATPLVLALGALARRGTIDPVTSLFAAAAGSLCASLLWFHLGRRFGARVLATACRISLEPDACVSKTKDLFSRYGVRSLILAKFLPALDILSAPLSGALGIGTASFVLWSSAGAFLWLVVFGGLGYLFGAQIGELIEGL